MKGIPRAINSRNAGVFLLILLIIALALLALSVRCTTSILSAGTEATASPPAMAGAEQPQPVAGLGVAASPVPAPRASAGEAAAPAEATSPGEAAAPASASAAGWLVACGASGDLDWSTTSTSLQVIKQCTLTVPHDGWAFITANSTVSARGCEYEAHFRLGIDDTDGDAATDRWVNVYADSTEGMDAVVAVSLLKPVTAGEHTFYFLGRRSGGTGTVLLRDPALAVLAFAPGALSLEP